jgi:transglutaminase-like putative cysteine protease
MAKKDITQNQGPPHEMKKYLTSSKYINCENASVIKKAAELSSGCSGDENIAEACFEFVRDEIRHSHDFKLSPTTVTASEVLESGTGYCYAKSHLLAALLRANKIPAGLCYQRLTIENDAPPFCLHGLNAVYLEKHGWYRVDARGNKENVDARFCPPIEKLAFPIAVEGECDFRGIWPEPLPMVVEVLEKYKTYNEVYSNLPDIEIIKMRQWAARERSYQ